MHNEYPRIERNKDTHIDDFLHVNPSKLLTPEVTLKTSERNQKKLTIPLSGSDDSSSSLLKVNWSVVAVTLEKNVAIVVMLTNRVVSRSFSFAKKVGKANKDLNQ